MVIELSPTTKERDRRSTERINPYLIKVTPIKLVLTRDLLTRSYYDGLEMVPKFFSIYYYFRCVYQKKKKGH